MRATLSVIFIASMWLLFCPVSGWAQQYGDWGDAPENALAYPDIGVIGFFPTCHAPPAAYIWHNPLGWAKFEVTPPGFDAELDGNAGICPQPPYDQDECWADGDAGLVFPSPSTVAGNTYVPCVPPGQSLGVVCQTAAWGGNLDIRVVNNMPVDGYVNVLMDWDRGGSWGGASQCAGGLSAPEHVLVNWVIPSGSGGPLSGFNPPPFLIGPNAGHVWTRFSITESPVVQDWDGSGAFEDGETEDYLFQIDPPPSPSLQTSWGRMRTLYR